MKKILIIFGTRPEAIKFAPLYKSLKDNSDIFETRICVTAQHREMLDQVLKFFNIEPDYDMNLMRPNQTLSYLTSSILTGLEPILEEFQPDLVFVQGDTTTTFIAALASYYKKIKIAHLEAGLRSFNKYSPFPEEINRVLTSNIADFHFAPTQAAVKNLEKEGFTNCIFNVGNTVIDALLQGINIVDSFNQDKFYELFNTIDFSKRIILVTGHRRESFGEPFKDICRALKSIAEMYSDIEIIYPVHLNPNVMKPVYDILSDKENIHLIKPLDYEYLIWLMNKSYIVLTDSGGIQEEAPSLGKPVLVMREVTERTEGVESGTALLVGTDTNKIVSETVKLLNDSKHYEDMAQAVNPYGDGKTSQRIIDYLKVFLT